MYVIDMASMTGSMKGLFSAMISLMFYAFLYTPLAQALDTAHITPTQNTTQYYLIQFATIVVIFAIVWGVVKGAFGTE